MNEFIILIFLKTLVDCTASIHENKCETTIEFQLNENENTISWNITKRFNRVILNNR